MSPPGTQPKTGSVFTDIILGHDGRDAAFVRQLPLAVPMLAVGLLSSVLYPVLLANGLFLAGYAVLLLSLVLAKIIPWHTLPSQAEIFLPLMGFLAIGLARAGSLTVLDIMGTLTVLPMIKLAVSQKFKGVWIGTVCTLLVVAAPLLTNISPVTSQQLARLTVLPVVALFVGVAITYAVKQLDIQSRSLRDASARLETSLSQSREQGQLLRSVLEAVDVGVVAVAADGTPVLANKRGLAEQVRAAKEARKSGGPQEAWYALGEAQRLMFEADRVTPIPPDRRPIARAIRGEKYSNYLFWIDDNGRQLAYCATSRPIASSSDSGPVGGLGAASDDGGTVDSGGPVAVVRDPSDDGGPAGAVNSPAGFVVAFSDVTQLLEASTAQSDFVATISHELRTPLTSILGYTDLLRDRLEEEGITELSELGVIERNAERLHARVEELVTAAESAMSVSPIAADLSALIDAALATIAPLAATHNVTLDNRAHEPLVALVDPSRICQVLDNLLSNAVKYSPGTTVTVSAWEDLETGQAVVEIVDRGVGIEAEHLEQVFTQFFRAPSARRSSVSGFGLGLGIVKSIVDRHGGTVGLSSEPGRGTVAALRLPLG